MILSQKRDVIVFEQARGTANAAQTWIRHRKQNLFSKAGKEGRGVVPVTLIRVVQPQVFALFMIQSSVISFIVVTYKPAADGRIVAASLRGTRTRNAVPAKA
jgi:hypothetical protein